MAKLAVTARSFGDTDTANTIARDYINNHLISLNENELFTKENIKFYKQFPEHERKILHFFAKMPTK